MNFSLILVEMGTCFKAFTCLRESFCYREEIAGCEEIGRETSCWKSPCKGPGVTSIKTFVITLSEVVTISGASSTFLFSS